MFAVSRLGSHYNFPSLPSDLCYLGATFSIWALTQKLGGKSVRFGSTLVDANISAGESIFVVILLLANLLFFVFFYPIPIPAGASATSQSGWLWYILSYSLGGILGVLCPFALRGGWIS
jgi:hypothetical protein